MEKEFTKEDYLEYADILKVLAHPVRLCIINGLTSKGHCNVSNMCECLNTSQPIVSQHLAKLKAAGIIKGERAGTEIIYHIENQFASDIVKSIEKLKKKENKK